MLPGLPRRIECFDISHIQGAETVASMVVWEDGTDEEVRLSQVHHQGRDGWTILPPCARWSRGATSECRKDESDAGRRCQALVLIDGGIGQLHSAAQALESLGIVNQPLASIAKREEIIYVQGQEDDPVVLDRHSPVLHLVQLVRDEAHRFAVTFHRKRREIRDRKTELLEIPGVANAPPSDCCSILAVLQAVKDADAAALASVVSRPQADAILRYFREDESRS